MLLCRSLAGAWIEITEIYCPSSKSLCRSLAGAWIEIHAGRAATLRAAVAPLRERGLKYKTTAPIQSEDMVAPLRGAWIEI